MTAGRLAGDALAEMIGAVAHVQRSIADRTFTAVGSAAAPPRAIYQGVTNGVSATVRSARVCSTPRCRHLGDRRQGRRTIELERLRAPGFLSALNGLRGDKIAERYPELAVTMSLRDDAGRALLMRSRFARRRPALGW